ncbi:MAG: hypothetical protein R3B57_03515 [Phycisphaerales bacterium]
MTTFPNSPNLLKGALIAFPSQTAVVPTSVILFQYNPQQVSRSLAQRTEAGAEQSKSTAQDDAQKTLGPPEESYFLSILLDATDYLESPEQHAIVAAMGLHPVLAALEMLLYPSTTQVLLTTALSALGVAELSPQELPLVMLVFGGERVVPVRLESISVTEEAFDPLLNPIRARVDLSMKVLTYLEQPQGSVGRAAYLTYQVRKEVSAALYPTTVVTDVITQILEA